jgi:hypothetical protein
MTARARPWMVTVLTGAVLLAGCVPASPDRDTYLGKVSVTLGGALSEVATVQVVLEALHDGEMFRSTAIVQVRDSQSSLDTNAGAFNEIDPPPDLDRLYDRTNALLTAGTQAVQAARLAIDRRQVGRYADLAHDLERIAKRLDTLEAKTS